MTTSGYGHNTAWALLIFDLSVTAKPLLDGVVKAERQAHGAAPDTWIALNNLAILYSNTGRVSNAIALEEDRASEALSELREAIATGYKPKPPPESDPLLKSLVGMPGFADAVRGVSQK